MMKYFDYRQSNLEQGKEKYIEMPLAKEMKDAEYGSVNVGILGLTIKEVGESVGKSRELKDIPQYNEEL